MNSGLGRYYFAKWLPVIAIIVIGLTVFLAWFAVTKLMDESRTDPGARPSASQTDSLPATPKRNDKERNEAEINRQVKAFSRLYFSLSPDFTSEEAKLRVMPYVTDNFLRSAQFGFGSSIADRAMISEGASLKVRAITELVGHPDGANAVDGSVQLRIIKLDRDGNVLFEPREVTQSMTLIRQGDTWLIDSVPSS